MTDTLALATSLRAWPDEAIRTLLTARSISPDARISDLFDLADLLFDPERVQQALSHLDRRTLALASGAPVDPSDDADVARQRHLVTLALGTGAPRAVDPLDIDPATYRTFTAVSDVLAGWPERGLPDAEALADEPAPAIEGFTATGPASPGTANGLAGSHSPADGVPAEQHHGGHAGVPSGARSTQTIPVTAPESLASERAFEALSAVAEMIIELTQMPARELGRGGLGQPDTKRMAESMHVEPTAVTTYFDLARRAGFVTLESTGWLSTPDGERWLRGSIVDRWSLLASTWLESVPTEVRAALAPLAQSSWGQALTSYAAWLYPAGSGWITTQLARVTAQAEALGITTTGHPTSVGVTVLEQGADAAAALLADSLPHQVDNVYIQHDLSIVSPGPLNPTADLRLRGIAGLEARAQAASYRLSAESVTKALSSGETADSILEFLSKISLTGIPQPVDYLVRESAKRFGRVRVGSLPESESGSASGSAESPAGARTYVRSDDEHLISQISVDHSLTAVALQQSGRNRLVSRFADDVVFWALVDARYPVAAETIDGEIRTPRRRALRARPTPAPPADFSPLIARLRENTAVEGDASDEAWLARQLDAAIKAKQTVLVLVSLPGGVEREFLLEPTAVAAGRLRGRDRAADIERTLPIKNITRLKPA
ncbi:helicase-associated domain-containing protein [Okibacterium fritillariae]|uniref:Helicase conserved C-terminal domain-containing protein n=1 Tax=Okibacterium fritillariae TaxID=123320 RepID=A0A1T5IWI7_9MICO|nr:helicase-associated domain-containing protein [Okibacterium fritillariae]SKC43328.1 Helicase conserved C-terminal domain-containing protein [Okibacterium fritillariae]